MIKLEPRTQSNARLPGNVVYLGLRVENASVGERWGAKSPVHAGLLDSSDWPGLVL